MSSDDAATGRSSMTASQMRAFLIGWVAEIRNAPREEIDVHRPLDEYGLDSLDAVEMTNKLEEMLDSELDPTLPYDHRTIDAIVDYLVRESKITADG